MLEKVLRNDSDRIPVQSIKDLPFQFDMILKTETGEVDLVEEFGILSERDEVVEVGDVVFEFRRLCGYCERSEGVG